MQYCTDPRTGNSLSVLGYGCMRFPTSEKATEALILRSIALGINYFDTAYIYGNSEATLGRIVERNGLRDKMYIATKLPLQLIRGPKDFDTYFNRQLERLRTDHIDYYLMHMLSDMAQWKRLCAWGIEKWIQEKQASGAIRQIGFSFHGTRDEFLALVDAYDWDFCQIQYNYSDINYQAGVTGLHRAAEKGLLVVIMEPLLGGRLVQGLPSAALSTFKRVSPEQSAAAWGLRWLYDQEQVHVVLSGMGSMEQLEDNAQTAASAQHGMISDAERQAYDHVQDILSKANRIPCTGCGYCMPCPQHVDIPACFSAYNASFAASRMTGIKQYITATAPLSPQRNNAGQCNACGRCERHCPQHIAIRKALGDVRGRLEPAWLRAGVRIARTVMRSDAR